MKNTLLITALGFFSLTLVEAATTITVGNIALGGTGFATQVRIAQGGTTQPYLGGSVMIGTFSSTTGLGTGSIQLADFGWSLFASAPFSAGANFPGIFGGGGAVGATGNLPTTATGPLVGNPIFAVIANPTNDEFIIWQTNRVFATEDAVLGGASVGVLTRDATLIRGAILANGTSGLGGPAAGFNGQDAVTFIPEPSVALLGAFGVLGLLRRRR